MVQKWPFFQLFLLGNIDQENVFYDILERKNAFLGYKNKKFKRSKNGHFSNFFGGDNRGQENVFYDILKRKSAILRYKNKQFKKSKNWLYSKRVYLWCCPKNGHFSNFFLGNIGHENVFDDILERKYGFLGYKNKKFKKSKNWRFSKRVYPWFWSKNGHFFQLFFKAI